MKKFIVIKDDIVIGSFDTIDEAKACILDDSEKQKLSLLMSKKLLKRFLKKNIPLNLSNYFVAVLQEVNT